MKNIIYNFSLYLFCSIVLTCISCSKEDCPSASTKNTEIVKQLFGYFGTGDIASFLNGCTSDCIFDITGNQILNPGKVYTGHTGFMTFLGDLTLKGQPTNIQPIDFYESENVVTVNGKIEFKDFVSGRMCKANFIQIWKFNQDSKLIYFKEDHDNRVCE
jgi:ketosteroid isomerase-like protein